MDWLRIGIRICLWTHPMDSSMDVTLLERPIEAYGPVYGDMDVKKVLLLQHKLPNPRPAKHGEHPATRRHHCTRPARPTVSTRSTALWYRANRAEHQASGRASSIGQSTRLRRSILQRIRLQQRIEPGSTSRRTRTGQRLPRPNTSPAPKPLEKLNG